MRHHGPKKGPKNNTRFGSITGLVLFTVITIFLRVGVVDGGRWDDARLWGRFLGLAGGLSGDLFELFGFFLGGGGFHWWLGGWGVEGVKEVEAGTTITLLPHDKTNNTLISHSIIKGTASEA